jgi:hypothetical protein
MPAITKLMHDEIKRIVRNAPTGKMQTINLFSDCPIIIHDSEFSLSASYIKEWRMPQQVPKEAGASGDIMSVMAERILIVEDENTNRGL